LAPNVTVILNGCGLGAKGSDEIGRIGAKLATTQQWTNGDMEKDECKIYWRKTD